MLSVRSQHDAPEKELDELLLLLFDELDDEQQGQSEYVVVVGMN
jgi:hypothetical protein